MLCEFRARLVSARAETLLFETLLSLCNERGWVKARGKQRTDSSHVLAAIHALMRLELLGETLRRALDVLAVAAPEWLREHVQPDWLDRYARRFEDARLPRSKEEQKQLALTVARDGYSLLQALWSEGAYDQLRSLPAVETLRQTWVQQFYREAGRDGEVIELRETDNTPTAAERINTLFDPDARYSIKRDVTWTGYKVFLTEVCEPEMPHLITHVATTPATTQDGTLTASVHADLKSADLLPSEHLVDATFLDAELLVSSQRDYSIDLIGPFAKDGSWQKVAGQGFDAMSFDIDWESQTATCPRGKQSRRWEPRRDSWGNALIHIRFSSADCSGCPSRALCTRVKSGARSIYLRPKEQYEALQRARERPQSKEFWHKYAARAGIEGAFSQGERVCGLRRSRYIGLSKTHLQNLMIASALNVMRLVAWLKEVPLARTRTSAFARLMRPPSEAALPVLA